MHMRRVLLSLALAVVCASPLLGQSSTTIRLATQAVDPQPRPSSAMTSM